MSVQPSKHACRPKMAGNPLFDDHPEVGAFIDSMNEAVAKFSAAMEKVSGETRGRRIAGAWKCLIGLCRDLDAAQDALGLKNDAEPPLISQILSDYDRHTPRQLSLGEQRAIRVATVYQSGFRPSFVGPKDTPMEAALQVAAYLEGLPLDTGPETIRKSIQRFRKSIVGEEMFKLDRATLEWEVHRAEDVLLNGLPNRSGRPRKKQGQVDK